MNQEQNEIIVIDASDEDLELAARPAQQKSQVTHTLPACTRW